MPNKNYLRGVRYERKLVNQARSEGHIASRSAGSHSPIDVWVYEPKNRVIRMIQCKTHKKKTPKNMDNPFMAQEIEYGFTVIKETRHSYVK